MSQQEVNQISFANYLLRRGVRRKIDVPTARSERQTLVRDYLLWSHERGGLSMDPRDPATATFFVAVQDALDCSTFWGIHRVVRDHSQELSMTEPWSPGHQEPPCRFREDPPKKPDNSVFVGPIILVLSLAATLLLVAGVIALQR